MDFRPNRVKVVTGIIVGLIMSLYFTRFSVYSGSLVGRSNILAVILINTLATAIMAIPFSFGYYVFQSVFEKR
ncbi:hypothetical protein JXB31_05230 [Candidatus Woesearchaeota archaeon]|nr:hypothetical protein [Candidatus Woesearchaeota archaeon]